MPTSDQFQIGDRVVINPAGRYPTQGAGAIGVIIQIESYRGNNITVEWGINEGFNVYASRDILFFDDPLQTVKVKSKKELIENIEFYLLHGSPKGFWVRRDLGESIYLLPSSTNRSPFARISPRSILALKEFKDVFESFGKRIGRKVIIVNKIEVPKKYRDCRRTNWYVVRPHGEKPEPKPDPPLSVDEYLFDISSYYGTGITPLVSRIIRPF